MSRRNIEVINYAGLPRRCAEAIMHLSSLLDGAGAVLPPEEQAQLRHLECLDDIQGILAGDRADQHASPFVQAYCQKRWLGTGMIANLQNPSILPAEMIGNTGTVIAFRIPNPDEAAYVCDILRAPKETRNLLQNLPPRHFLCLSEGFESCVHGMTPTIRTGPPPDGSEIARHMKPVLDDLATRTEMSPPFDDGEMPIAYGDEADESPHAEQTVPVSKAGLLEEEIVFLRMVAEKERPIAELYRALGLSAGTGNKIKNQMLKAGLVVADKRRSNLGRPSLVLILTPAGKELARDFNS